MRQTPAAVNSYDFALDVADLKLPSHLRNMIGKKGESETLQTLKLNATVVFDAPWDRYAIEQQRPQPVRIDLKTAQATWYRRWAC